VEAEEKKCNERKMLLASSSTYFFSTLGSVALIMLNSAQADTFHSYRMQKEQKKCHDPEKN
jgi:hypothetical protein